MKTKLHSLFILLALFVGVRSVTAQNTVFTYQGRLVDNGTNFTGTGLFQFALVTSTNANQTTTATNPVSGFITTINVTFGGSGYLTAPAVTIFGGGGSGATATATISNGVVTSVNINPGGNGSGYTSIPNGTIASPPPNFSYTTYSAQCERQPTDGDCQRRGDEWFVHSSFGGLDDSQHGIHQRRAVQPAEPAIADLV